MQSIPLVSHLFSSLQSRPNGPKIIYKLFTLFENQKEPSLLSDKGKWRSGENLTS